MRVALLLFAVCCLVLSAKNADRYGAEGGKKNSFSGVEIVNHSGGPVLITVTCFSSGHKKTTGVISSGDYKAVRTWCPPEGEQ